MNRGIWIQVKVVVRVHGASEKIGGLNFERLARVPFDHTGYYSAAGLEFVVGV